jgi:hypothetical protein
MAFSKAQSFVLTTGKMNPSQKDCLDFIHCSTPKQIPSTIGTLFKHVIQKYLKTLADQNASTTTNPFKLAQQALSPQDGKRGQRLSLATQSFVNNILAIDIPIALEI